VIDITKGIQTQTAECLVIGEITTKKLVVVLNKVSDSWHVRGYVSVCGVMCDVCTSVLLLR
jgi:hypothetical protein